MERSNTNNRQGFSLLELLVSVTLLVTVVTSVSVLMRVNYETWLDYRSDNLRTESATGVVRHVVRQIRQCQGVVSVSGNTDHSGSLALLMPDGSTVVWDHDGTDVHYGEDTASQLLGNHISGLNFVAYQRDGTTVTTVAEDIQCIQVTVEFELPSRTEPSRSISSKAWVRSF